MECHEGAKMIKTFRGLIPDGAEDTIALHTNDGSMGYRIVKFQLMTNTPGVGNAEHIVKIYSVSQTAIDAIVDFSDNTLLGVGLYATNASSTEFPAGNNPDNVIFDNMVINQDIYLTHSEITASLACNYYLELEQVKLDVNENTVATLKDIRNKELRTMTA